MKAKFMRTMGVSSQLTPALIEVLSLSDVPGASEPPKQNYEPRVGQEGKDVVWVPTPEAMVQKMLDTANVTAKCPE